MVAEEDRPGVVDPLGHGAGVASVNLQVLGGVGVGDGYPLVRIAHQHHRRLRTGQRLPDAHRVLGQFGLGLHLFDDLRGQVDRVGDEHRGGGRVVLVLGDQVDADQTRKNPNRRSLPGATITHERTF